MTPRDKKVIEDSERRNIPIFVFTAKDILSAHMLHLYKHAVEQAGCSQDLIKGVDARWTEFEDWQTAHPLETKIPD